jgi:hypothetical protein
MKRTRTLLIATASILICVGVGFGQDARNELDRLVDRWTRALINEDIDTFLDCYWADAIRVNYNPQGVAEITEGMEELRAAEEKGFAEIDFPSLNLVYDEPVRFFPRHGRPTYIYPNSRYGFMNVFEFERRGGEYRIIRQYLLPHPSDGQ